MSLDYLHRSFIRGRPRSAMSVMASLPQNNVATLTTPAFLNSPNIYNSDSFWSSAPLDQNLNQTQLNNAWDGTRNGGDFASENQRARCRFVNFNGRICWRQKIEEHTTGVDQGAAQVIKEFAPQDEAYSAAFLYFPQWYPRPPTQKMAGGLGGGPDPQTASLSYTGRDGFSSRFLINPHSPDGDSLMPDNAFNENLFKDRKNDGTPEDEISLDDAGGNFQVLNGVWALVMNRVKVNTVGFDNGISECWMGMESRPGAADWFDASNVHSFRKQSSVSNRRILVSGGTCPGVEYYYHAAHVGGTGRKFRMAGAPAGLEHFFLTGGVYVGTSQIFAEAA